MLKMQQFSKCGYPIVDFLLQAQTRRMSVALAATQFNAVLPSSKFDKGPNTEPCGIPSSFNSLAAQIQPTIKQVMGR